MIGLSSRSSGSSKEKNVGYVLEHLIGAMTVQKMMDERKEASTPVHQEDEEHVQDAELSADDVCISCVYG